MRADVLAGVFVPGQRLIEAELCERYGASRGTVRNVLASLEHEGIVERIANRGARIRVVEVDEAVEITEVRMVLEGLCAAKAAERVSDVEVAEFRRIGEEMQDRVDRGDVVAYSNLNRRLHRLVSAVAAQSKAEEVLARLRAQNVHHQFRLALKPGRATTSLPQHLALIEAICERDPQAAEAAMREHLRSVIAALKDEPRDTENWLRAG